MPASAPQTDDALLAAFALGDHAAFERFYRRHLAGVVGFHRRRTGSAELAFDLTAETFAAVVESCRSFDPARGSAAQWLFGIAANALRESARRARVEDEARRRLDLEPVAMGDDELTRVEALATTSSEEQVEALLADMTRERRDAILAHVVDERPYAELAQAWGCSEQVVRQRVARGLRQLRARTKGVTR